MELDPRRIQPRIQEENLAVISKINTPKHYQIASAIFFVPWVTSTSGRSIQHKL